MSMIADVVTAEASAPLVVTPDVVLSDTEKDTLVAQVAGEEDKGSAQPKSWSRPATRLSDKIARTRESARESASQVFAD